MALPHEQYPPFLGLNPGKPQGYEDAHYGAPSYHIVLSITENHDPSELAWAADKYREGLYPSAPRMCLLFPKRGTVWVDCFDSVISLRKKIDLIQRLAKVGSLDLSYREQFKSFMGECAFMAAANPYAVVYDIDPKLAGRRIAREAIEHLTELRKRHKFDRLLLRWPNGATVDVDFFTNDGRDLLHLSTAIQRARRMELPEEIAAEAA